MPPHAIRFEVIVRPQKQGFTANGLLIRQGDLIGARRHHRVQQAQRGIGAKDAVVDLGPFLVQIAVGVTQVPLEDLDAVDGVLVPEIGSLVRVIAGDAAPYPIADGAPPCPGAGFAVQRPVRGDERAFHTDLVHQGRLIDRALRGLVQEAFAGVRDAGDDHQSRPAIQQSLPHVSVHRLRPSP